MYEKKILEECLDKSLTLTVDTLQSFALANSLKEDKNYSMYLVAPIIYLRVVLLKLLVDDLEKDIAKNLRQEGYEDLIESTFLTANEIKKKRITSFIVPVKNQERKL